MNQVQRRLDMTNKIAAYKRQVDYQVALDKKVNEILERQSTERAASLMNKKYRELLPTERKELGLLSEAELKKHAAIEKRMNAYIKEHEPQQFAAKEAQVK